MNSKNVKFAELEQQLYGTSDYKVLREIFNKVDPIGVANMVEDEYGPEIVRILEILPKCKTINDVKALVLRVIIQMFDEQTAARNDNYLKIATEIINKKDRFDFKVWF